MTDGPARRVALELDRRGLAVPSRLLVDAHRPLAPLIGDMGAAFAPLIGAVLGRRATDLGSIVDDPAGLDRLLEELDRTQAGGTRADPR